MRERILRSPGRLALATALLAAVTSGCSNGTDESDDGPADPPAPSRNLQQALAEMPSSTSYFEFRDVHAAEKRLDVEDADLKDYMKATAQDMGWAASTLVPYLPIPDLPWKATDVAWEAVTDEAPDGLTIRQLEPDIDLRAAVDTFKDAGYQVERDDESGVVLTAEIGDLDEKLGEYLVPFGLAVLIRPDEQLVVSTPSLAALDAYIDGDESLADAGTYDGLIAAESMGIEYVFGSTDARICKPSPALSQLQTSTAAVEEALEPYEELRTPRAAAISIGPIDGEPAAAARLRFTDASAAEADLDARKDLLEDGASLVNQKPFSKSFAVDDISTDGAVTSIALAPSASAMTVVTMIHSQDAPFYACAPTS